jgi:predicted nucleic acid-binding Zn ribbon protein
MVDVHKHCPVCGMPIPLNETTCSDKCQEVLINRSNKVKKTRLILYWVIILFIIVWIFNRFFIKL